MTQSKYAGQIYPGNSENTSTRATPMLGNLAEFMIPIRLINGLHTTEKLGLPVLPAFTSQIILYRIQGQIIPLSFCIL